MPHPQPEQPGSGPSRDPQPEQPGSGPSRSHDRPGEHRDAAALLATGIARARSGTGGLVLLRGATGTGRTSVLEAAAEDAAAQGMRVLRARCAPGYAAGPFAAVHQLLDRVAAFDRPGPDADEREHADRLWRILHAHAGDSAMLLAVDDVHLADGPSYRWLVEAARHVGRLPLPVLLAVTERSQYDIDPPAPGFTHTLSPALVDTHTLAPLTTDSAARLVRAEHPGAPAEWIETCARAGAGSPLLLRALLDDLGAVTPRAPAREPAGSAPADAPSTRSHVPADDTPAPWPPVPETSAALYPGSYPAAVQWWLDSAGPATAEVARVLAVLEDIDDTTGQADGGPGPSGGGPESAGGGFGRFGGGPELAGGGFGPFGGGRGSDVSGPACAGGGPRESLAGLLAELAGADPARVAGWLTAMTGLGVLRPGPDGRPRYAHPLLRDAVLTGVPDARRRAVHRAAAQAMLHRGAPTSVVALQLLRSGPVGAPWAPAVLRDATVLALRDGRSDQAVAFLRRALQEPLPEDHRQRTLTELGSLEFAGREPSAGMNRLTEALRLHGTPHDRVRAAVALGTALAGRGRTRAAVEVLRSVDGQLTGHPDLGAALQTASALLSDQDQTVRQDVYRSLSDTAEHAPELVGPAARALLVRYAATAALTSADDAMRRMRALLAEPAHPLTEPFLLGTAAAVAQWADELDEADRLVDRGLAGQRPDLLHPMHAALLNTRADIAAARGRYALLPAERPGPAHGPSNVHATTLIALVETGRTEEARRLADGFDLREAPDNWELNRFLYARGVQRAAAGDTAGALHDFLECGRRQTAREVVSPVVTPWRSAAAECRLALGSTREALALAEEELRLARVWNTPRTVGRALRVLGAVTGGRRGLRLAEEAVGLLAAAPAAAQSELVAALLAQGRQLTAAGERARARECLRTAARHAERLGAVRLRTLAEEALREGGARRAATARTGSGSLTGSELRIARLAAEGRTNTEIAGLLHLARRTVETHLTSTYKKLGIRRRAELGQALNGD
ncbi:LuxR C-terminal-related transcriptional regulator [Streptomyces sp. NPDC056373]|uniref:helix-turn-helix transcriptional regulator n=1 Tax=Streptomyces sp. NPDC056373 TaxID=3345798 RepID=UPI0035DA8A5B